MGGVKKEGRRRREKEGGEEIDRKEAKIKKGDGGRGNKGDFKRKSERGNEVALRE